MKIKVYFGAAISVDRSLLPIYRKIVNTINEEGGEVLSQHVVDPNYQPGGGVSPKVLYRRQINLLAKADVMVAEVTVPSWGTAFLIEQALKMGKPVLALFYKDQEAPLPAMVAGHPELYLEHYSEDNIQTVIKHNFAHFAQMTSRRGKLIVIDGADGSGKATQAKMLLEYLDEHRIKHKEISFPRYYTSFHGRHVWKFLHGEFGKDGTVSPYLTSLAFALDRLTAKDEMVEWLQEGNVVVADRYVSASMAHQGGKMPEEKREEFLDWLYQMEYMVHKLPKEDIVLYLYVPVETAQKLIAQREKAGETSDKVDTDVEYQRKSIEMYKKLTEKHPHWVMVSCVNDKGEMLSKEEIHERIVGLLHERKII
jgi:dTMP kinase